MPKGLFGLYAHQYGTFTVTSIILVINIPSDSLPKPAILSIDPVFYIYYTPMKYVIYVNIQIINMAFYPN